MRRGLVAWIACGLAFGAGLLTAALAVENRARGDELDRAERWCEAQSRQNELQRVANQRAEWQLLSPERATAPGAPREAAP
jgi:hypothetical protein